MTNAAIEVCRVWKRFRRGETHDSLRDLVPAATRRLIGLRPKGARVASREFWALKDISFQVKPGEIVGIIGANGAGKSTILKILSRILRPNSGRVCLNGRLSALIEVGAGFHPDLTGRENVYLNGTILGMRRAEITRKFDEIVAFAEIEEFIDTPVKRYSSGMYLRLAFAVAAHLEPEILIVDEVLAVGDTRFQRKCLTKMQDVGQQGRTVLFVSHNMPAITRLCERAILLDQGRLIQDGPSPQTVKAYLNSSLGTTAAREWNDPVTAPHGTAARLRAVCLRTADGQITETADIQQPLDIEMQYEVLKPGYVLMPYHHIHNEDGVFLFSAHDLDPAWRYRPRGVGRWVSTARIPGNLLAEGTHFVSTGLMTLDPVIPQFYLRDVMAFQVIDSLDRDSTRGGWAGPMGGVMRPLLEWRTQFTPAPDIHVWTSKNHPDPSSLLASELA
jgi:lipopolysaccharide transport system ATP-binding protein